MTCRLLESSEYFHIVLYTLSFISPIYDIYNNVLVFRNYLPIDDTICEFRFGVVKVNVTNIFVLRKRGCGGLRTIVLRK